jgi:hypothetical protein
MRWLRTRCPRLGVSKGQASPVAGRGATLEESPGTMDGGVPLSQHYEAWSCVDYFSYVVH